MILKINLAVIIFGIFNSLTSSSEISSTRLRSTNYMIREKSDLIITFQYNLDQDSEVQLILDEKFEEKSEGFSCINLGKKCSCIEESRTFHITTCFEGRKPEIVRLTISNFSNPLYAGFASFKLLVLKSGQIEGYKNSSLVLEYSPQPLEASLTSKTEEANKFSIWLLEINLKYLLSTSDQVKITSPTKCSSDFTCSNQETFSCKCSSSVITLTLKTAQSSEFSLELVSMRNPETTGETFGFSIETSSSLGAIQLNTNISISISRGSSISSTSSFSEEMINKNSSLYIEFFCDNIIPEDSDLFIDFPLALEIFGNTSIMGIFGISSFLDTVFDGNYVRLGECFENSWSENKTAAFRTEMVKNPSTTQPAIGYLTVEKDERVYCEGEFQVVATRGEIGFQVRAEDYTVNALTSYYLRVFTEFEWNGACLMVFFPEGFDLTSSKCDGCLISEQLITITNVTGFELKVTVYKVKNYHLTSESEVFTVISLTSCEGGYEIERNETVSLSMTPGVFSASITLSSYTTGDFSSFLFEMNISNLLPGQSSIIINFPSSLTISNLQQGLKNTENINRYHNLLLTSSSINISKAVSNDFTGLIRFSLEEIQNPASLEPVKIEWFTKSEGYLIDFNIYSLEMKTAHIFKFISISSDSYIVGGQSTYEITIFPYNLGYEQVVLYFDYEIGDAYSDTLMNFSNNSVILNNFESTSRIYFKLFNVTNPASTKPENIFINSLKNGFLSDSESFEFTADTPGELYIEISNQDIKISSLFSLNLNISTSNKIQSASSLIFQYTSPTAYCLEQDPIESCNFLSDSIQINTSNILSSLTLTFQNLSSELISGLYSYSICSYSERYVVDCGLVNLTFTCDDICKSCAFSPSNCTSCYYSTFLYNNTCSGDCLETFYKKDSVCESCQSPCVTCSSLKICMSCSSIFPYFFNDFCYRTCPDGSFPTTSFNCSKCLDNCLLCTSLNSCQSCKSGLVNFLFECVERCPSGYYEKLGVCLECGDFCGKCVDDLNCQECISGYYLYEKSCLDTCPEGITIPISGNCINCEKNCKTCSTLPENCTSCSNPKSLFKNDCIQSCPSGFYSSSNICEICSNQCLTCSKSSYNCLSCSSPLNLFESSCVETCPVGLLPLNQSCKCEAGCKSCNISGCLACESSLKLYNGTCLKSCPSSTFESSSSCINCSPSCSSCSSLSLCESCMTGFFLYQSTCYASCPNFTFSDENSCQNCEFPCIECESLEICSLCEDSYLLMNSSCVADCPEGYSELLSMCVPDSSECSENCTFQMSKDQQCDWNCYVKACNFDSDMCPQKNYSNSLAINQVPVPISMTGGIGVAVAGASSLIFGSSFIAVAGPLCSLLETAAGVGLLVTVGLSDGTRGRELLNIDDSKSSSVFAILFILNLLHILGNLVFVFCFFKWIFPNDPEIRSWYSKFKCAARTVLLLCAFISYKFFRISWSKLFGLKACSLSLKNHRNLWTLMKFLHVFTIFFIEIPFAAVCVYIFLEFSVGSYAFIVAVDSLVVVSLVIILTIWEIFQLREKEKEFEKKDATVTTENIDFDHRSYVEEAKSRTDQSTDRRFNYFWKGDK